jgi:predicted RNA binding protein with dsRBD fold (UPF0201 family)
MYSSEDPEKVKKAISNIFRNQKKSFSLNVDRLLVSSSEEKILHHIYEKIRDKQIVAAVRRSLEKNKTDKGTHLLFNKQASFVEVLSICDNEIESPLGPIKLKINSSNLERVIDWLAPR